MQHGFLLTKLMTLAGCSTGWQMDYGEPAAQFESEDVERLGAPYIGRKVMINGTASRIDTSNPKQAWVYLEHGMHLG